MVKASQVLDIPDAVDRRRAVVANVSGGAGRTQRLRRKPGDQDGVVAVEWRGWGRRDCDLHLVVRGVLGDGGNRPFVPADVVAA